MEHGHWVPPNRGVTNLVTGLSYGRGSGSPTTGARTVPATNGTARRRGGAQASDPATGSTAHRSQRLTSTSERYGPAGVVQVARHYHGPGCPDCPTGTGVRTVPSAFGSAANFRTGSGR
ncbi:hypothetical protein ACFVGM_08685 [Kitasatospora purpeofusca]|uniref:hypothetical protein n=1 Tax=Kitasatospora purpeofusca TaxID=67352 RepID=UPI0036C0C41C